MEVCESSGSLTLSHGGSSDRVSRAARQAEKPGQPQTRCAPGRSGRIGGMPLASGTGGISLLGGKGGEIAAFFGMSPNDARTCREAQGIWGVQARSVTRVFTSLGVNLGIYLGPGILSLCLSLRTRNSSKMAVWHCIKDSITIFIECSHWWSFNHS